MGTETWRKQVELDGAETVHALVRMGSGKVNMSGGAEALLAGEFKYALPDWKPEVSYEVQDRIGQLRVQSPHLVGVGLGDPKYEWDLAWGNAVPVALSLELGSGLADLRMDKTLLSSLNAKVGSGSVTAELGAEQPVLDSVVVVSASGHLGLILPGSYPELASVDLKNASGKMDVALGGQYAALEKLQLQSASGGVNIGLAGGFPQLQRLAVKVASGTIDLNLLGVQCGSFDVTLECVSGKAVIMYPPGVGIAVRFSSISGKVQAPGLTKEDGRFVTPDYAEASCKINLSMSTVSGRLTLQPVDA